MSAWHGGPSPPGTERSPALACSNGTSSQQGPHGRDPSQPHWGAAPGQPLGTTATTQQSVAPALSRSALALSPARSLPRQEMDAVRARAWTLGPSGGTGEGMLVVPDLPSPLSLCHEPAAQPYRHFTSLAPDIGGWDSRAQVVLELSGGGEGNVQGPFGETPGFLWRLPWQQVSNDSDILPWQHE